MAPCATILYCLTMADKKRTALDWEDVRYFVALARYGTLSATARGLRVKMHRGVRTIGHDGLWPGYKTSFVRIPDHDAAVICISNDATSDPHDLAFQVVDALIEGKPGAHALPVAWR